MATGTIKNGNWKDSGLSATGTNSINISGLNFDELCVVGDYNNSGNKVAIVVPKLALGGSQWYRSGGYASASNSALLTCSITLGSVQMNSFYLHGADKTSTSTIHVYYR